MWQIFLSFIVSFSLTALSTPYFIKVAKKYGLVDDPNKRPHPANVQKRLIARAGGLPIYLGIITAIIFFVPIDKHVLGIILGITVLLVMGIFDDKLKNFSPLKRLFLQILSATIVVASGVGITFVTNPLGGLLHLDQIIYPINLFGTHNIVLLADIFAFFWIVWMMNMVNWAKGVDGQMAGIMGVAGLTIGFVSFNLFQQGDPNQLPIAVMSFITSGAAFGFLIFNWYPSKMLPGFSASNILAFMIAVLSILSGAKLAIILLVLLIPSVDFFYTFFRRIVTGHSPFLGDQKHLHHLLLKRGWSHQQISLFYITSCAILGLLATTLSSKGKLFTVIAVGAGSLGVILWLHFFSKDIHND